MTPEEIAELQRQLRQAQNDLTAERSAHEGTRTLLKTKGEELATAQGLVSKHSTDLATATESVRDLTSKLELATGKVTATTADLGKLSRERAISKIVHTEFKPLADEFDEELLLGLDGFEDDTKLREYLGKLAGKRAANVDANVDKALAGSTPAAPEKPKSPALTEDQMYDKLMTMRPSDEGYADLNKAYHDALAKKKK